MNKEQLLTKQQDLKEQFDKLTTEKSKLVSQTEEIDAELFRLQGDFRTLDNLIKEFKPIDKIPLENVAKTVTAKAKQ